MYYTLRASLVAAVAAKCNVLVLSEFGCNTAGHPPQEFASLMYKVIYEFQHHFSVIMIAIPSVRKEIYDVLYKVFERPTSSLLYWNGDYPRRPHPEAPWISGHGKGTSGGESGTHSARAPSASQQNIKEEEPERPAPEPQEVASIIEECIREAEGREHEEGERHRDEDAEAEHK